jgi:hypothetical protein
MRTALFRHYSSLRMPSLTNIEFATQKPLSKARRASVLYCVPRGFVKRETLTWAARA